MNNVTVKLSGGRYFEKALKYVRQAGGKYNGDKTWSVPTILNGKPNLYLEAPQNYGLIVAKKERTMQHDHNCAANFGGACECQE